MGIQCTITISRQTAIDRIVLINQLAMAHKYFEIVEYSNEPPGSVQHFVDSSIQHVNIHEWSNDMLSNCMDQPFYRFSMLENYVINADLDPDDEDDEIYCSECGGNWDEPGLYKCKESGHPESTLAQQIASAIEHDINDRRGMKMNSFDSDIQQEIRDTWVSLITNILSREQ